MEIVFFNRKGGKGVVSIQENFRPLIAELSKNNDVKVYDVPYDRSHPVNIIKNIFFIRKHSTKHGVNHITGDIHYGVLGLLGRKSVLTIHDDYSVRQARGGLFGKLYKLLFWIYLPIMFSKAPVCTTPSTLKNIKKYYNSKKLIVITHHVVPQILTDKKKPFNKECPVFLQIGTNKNKNLETTLEVLKNLCCKLIVLKPMSADQIKKANDYKINFENKWDLPYESVVCEYDKCDVVLFPSLFEGLGVPIFEGQAAGKPVITTNREPMNWTAGDGAVLLDDPLNVEDYRKAVLRVIHDDKYRNELVKKGKKNAERFSLKKSVEKYEELYKSLL